MLSWARQSASRGVREWSRTGKHLRRVSAELGLWGSSCLYVRKRLGTHGVAYPIRPRHADHPLYFRLGSTDLDVFHQIFTELEYAPLCALRDVRTVVDCGANVGYASAFFLSQFPACRIVAVEPDRNNFSMLQRNLRPYAPRYEAVRAGVWSDSVPLTMSTEPYRDGREWSIQVRPVEANETAEVWGISMGSLLDASGVDRVSLLKMDIEGAEAVVFRENVEWLDRVDAIAIELHDDSRFGQATDVFNAAIRGRGFIVSYSGELTICRRPEQSGEPNRFPRAEGSTV